MRMRCAQANLQRRSEQKRRQSKGRPTGVHTGESWLPLAREFLAPAADLLFELIEECSVVFADGIEQAREQQLARWTRTGQEIRNKIASALSFPFLSGK